MYTNLSHYRKDCYNQVETMYYQVEINIYILLSIYTTGYTYNYKKRGRYELSTNATSTEYAKLTKTC